MNDNQIYNLELLSKVYRNMISEEYLLIEVHEVQRKTLQAMLEILNNPEGMYVPKDTQIEGDWTIHIVDKQSLLDTKYHYYNVWWA